MSSSKQFSWMKKHKMPLRNPKKKNNFASQPETHNSVSHIQLWGEFVIRNKGNQCVCVRNLLGDLRNCNVYDVYKLVIKLGNYLAELLLPGALFSFRRDVKWPDKLWPMLILRRICLRGDNGFLMRHDSRSGFTGVLDSRFTLIVLNMFRGKLHKHAPLPKRSSAGIICVTAKALVRQCHNIHNHFIAIVLLIHFA